MSILELSSNHWLVQEGISFCIITNGKKPEKLKNLIESIVSQGLPKFEILIGGILPAGFEKVVFVPAEEAAMAGRLGEMRNKLTAKAQYQTLVVDDDDMIFQSDFGDGLAAHSGKFEVLCVRLLNPDGTRFWDWATYGGKRGHRLLDYDEIDENVYVSGGLSILKSDVVKKVQWSDEKGFYQGEDIDFSARLRAAGIKVEVYTGASVVHDDDRYTQIEHYVYREPNLNEYVELLPGVKVIGVYPAEPDGQRFFSPKVKFQINKDSLECPKRLELVLEAEGAICYDVFPFVVNVIANNKQYDKLTFDNESSSRKLIISIPPAEEDFCLEFESEATCIPLLIEGAASFDRRILSVRLKEINITAEENLDNIIDFATLSAAERKEPQRNVITFVAPLFDSSFSSKFARDFVASLANNAVPLFAKTISMQRRIIDEIIDIKEQKRLWHKVLGRRHAIGAFMVFVPIDAKLKIRQYSYQRRTNNGFDKYIALVNVPKEYQDSETYGHFYGYDEIWALDLATQKYFIDNGCQSEQVFLLPPGINIGLFPPRLLDEKIDNSSYLSVIGLDNDFAWKSLISAFLKAESDNPEARLVLFINDRLGRTRTIEKKINEYLEHSGYDISQQSRVKVIYEALSDSQIDLFYSRSSAYIMAQPSLDAYLGMLYAISQGLPVITTSDEFIKQNFDISNFYIVGCSNRQEADYINSLAAVIGDVALQSESVSLRAQQAWNDAVVKANLKSFSKKVIVRLGFHSGFQK